MIVLVNGINWNVLYRVCKRWFRATAVFLVSYLVCLSGWRCILCHLEVPSFVNLSCRGTEAPNFDGLQEFIQLVDPVLWKGYCFASCSWSDTLSRDWMHHLTNETAHIWMCYSEWRVNSNQWSSRIPSKSRYSVMCQFGAWVQLPILSVLFSVQHPNHFPPHCHNPARLDWKISHCKDISLREGSSWENAGCSVFVVGSQDYSWNA